VEFVELFLPCRVPDIDCPLFVAFSVSVPEQGKGIRGSCSRRVLFHQVALNHLRLSNSRISQHDDLQVGRLRGLIRHSGGLKDAAA